MDNDEQHRRDEYCRGLRAVADFLEENPEAALPFTNDLARHTDDKKIITAAARSPGKWKKEFSTYYFSLSQQFHGIALRYQCNRDAVCERKVIGTKLVPEYHNPEHHEDIVEWECKDALLKPTEE